MKVLFVEIDTEREWAVASIGPAMLGAFVRREGHTVEMLRVGVDDEIDAAVEEVRSRAPELVALSLTTRQWPRARRLVGRLRRALDRPVVAGGLHPTFSPEEVLAAPGFDYVCLGEGEEPFRDLLAAIEGGRSTDTIDNIWVRGGSRPRLQPPLATLDELPFLARDLLDEPRGVAHMATQRGCPYPCTYCAAGNWNELYAEVGRYGRRRGLASVLAELRELDRRRGLGYVIFLDDTFTLNRRWVLEFCERYRAELGRPFAIQARVETVDEELLARLAAAGCRQIAYGVESGSEWLRREVLRRPVPDQRFHDVFRWTREAGILVTANYMMGLPGETREDLECTVRLGETLPVDDLGYFVFYPYPGTRLYRVCLEQGLLPEDHRALPANNRRSILRLPDLPPEEIERAYDRFTEIRARLYRERYAGGASGEAAALESVYRSAATA